MTELSDSLEELERLRDGYFNLEVELAKSETRRQKAECQRDDLLVVCKELCEAIKLKGTSVCVSYAMASPTEENMTEEYVEANWIEHVAVCLGDAYRAAMEVMEKVKGDQ